MERAARRVAAARPAAPPPRPARAHDPRALPPRRGRPTPVHAPPPRRSRRGRAATSRRSPSAGQSSPARRLRPTLAAAWRAEAEAWDFADVNRLIEQHNRWYPVEAQLPMDPRTGDYAARRRAAVHPQAARRRVDPGALPRACSDSVNPGYQGNNGGKGAVRPRRRLPVQRSLPVKRFAAVLALLASTVAAGATAQSAQPAPHMLVGIFDEAETLGEPDTAFPMLKSLRTQVVRATMYWGGKGGVAGKKRPAHPTNPDDPAYSWGAYDNMVRAAAENKIKVLFSIWGTPAWANKSKGLNHAPTLARDLRNFSYAAAKRYSGTFVPDGGRPERVDRRAPAGPPVARVERARQPDLPHAAVQARRHGQEAPLGRAEPDRLRAHVRRRLHRRPLDAPAQREGRLRRHRAARQQQPVLRAHVDRPAPVPARRQEGGPQEVRRVGAPPVLRAARPRRPPRSRRRTAASAAGSRRPSCSATSRS